MNCYVHDLSCKRLHYTLDYFIARGNGCSVTPDEEERRAGRQLNMAASIFQGNPGRLEGRAQVIVYLPLFSSSEEH